tara:strand:+ start:61907 stop:62971 length:1065 start_codon:yes stop_codon:yes gene_type:complete
MKEKKVISGIQQIGIGVRNVHRAWDWYRKHFHMDIEVFEEEEVAKLMLPHTNNKPIPRVAVLALNMQGGGGYEIWQQTKYTPEPPKFELQLGDLGIYVCKQKCRDVNAFYQECIANKVEVLSDILTDPTGNETFYLKDPFGNIFQIITTNNWYKKEKYLTGGTAGVTIGVSDIENSLLYYQDIIGLDQVVYDETGVFDDLSALPGGGSTVRRVLLRNSQPRLGAFGKLLGNSEIELIQVLDRTPNPIFKDRIWGDLGFIHLCFDTRGMDLLKAECESRGVHFTVDSADSFDMGVAAGRFAYIADPDGTLIEFVETHRIPIIQKLNWHIKLDTNKPEKHLPNWMVNTLAWKRKKD